MFVSKVSAVCVCEGKAHSLSSLLGLPDIMEVGKMKH